jgi:putative PEP-CTERM system histidine kinase
MNTSTALIFLAAMAAYALFAVLLVIRGARSWTAVFFVVAATVTALWSGSAAAVHWFELPQWVPDTLLALRDGSWLALVLAVLYLVGRDPAVWRNLAIAAASVTLVHIAFSAADANLGTVFGVMIDRRTTGIWAAIVGLVLVENMMRNLSQDQFWAAKYLAIGLLAILGLQFLTRVPEFLVANPLEASLIVEPAVYLLVLPLLVVSAVRSPTLQLRIHSSRKVVFHTTALIIVGILLEGTALAAYYVRNYGGDGATVLSIVLGFSGAIAVGIAVTSTAVRSRLRAFLNENFFSYKYDYRLEWQKFIRALSSWEDDNIPLRVLRTFAELLDSPGGALWVFRESWSQFLPVAHWSLPAELAAVSPADPALSAFNDESCVVLDLSKAGVNGSTLLWQQRFPAAWLVVPLRYRSILVGIVLINRPRGQRQLDWEDESLIGLVALQLAAYLVQEETAQALADARQLAEFNKRFAFILHDTKNTIGQLGLLARNAEKYGHDENFRADMIITLRHSVDKLQELLIQLKSGGRVPASSDEETADLMVYMAELVEENRRNGLEIEFQGRTGPIPLKPQDAKAFIGVVDQMIHNAVEASPATETVKVSAEMLGSFVHVSIEDNGPGMTQQFITDQLFRPFRTTKGKGFGIGAYQARETIRDLGGEITVCSKVGEGTTISLTLPITMTERKVARA